MTIPAVFLYAEYQVSIPFETIEWQPIDEDMKTFAGLLSKTWLSGIKTNSVGGFYAFDSLKNAQAYIDGLLVPFAARIGGNLSVRLFDAEVTRAASSAIYSPYYPAASATP
ncbi:MULTISPECIES: YdhR family protein [unclassified Methylobacterium]|uniref:YdhR family protein n=1 Tax=unclassified Methylobacterium TaxID=2615210 RepID=UPI001355BA67|nr:YdhR family protein [Methylobacterium sp. 2A]MWV20966.1 YdhR family protein [Methylobacterium sp. 2A]